MAVMTSERACPGPENRRYREAWDAYRQALADYDPLDSAQSRPDPPEIQLWPGDPVWCSDCTALIGKKLAQLDILAGILAATADGLREPGDLERVSGSSGERPSPSRAGDDLDEMFTMLSTWETVYRDLKGWLPAPPRGEMASRETECIDWLRRHFRGILVSDVAADFGREILQWHREGENSAKAGRRTVRKPMRCPSCKFVTLFWTEGEKDVHCRNEDCKRVLSLSEYEDEAERQAAALQRDPDAFREENAAA
jgi:hypothetical protein